MTRALTEPEKLIIRRIAERLSDDRRKQLLKDMEDATAEAAGESGSRVVFTIEGYKRPPYRGQHSFGVAGSLRDKDGSEIALDLYADENDRLLELELIRVGSGPLIEPDWSSVELF